MSETDWTADILGQRVYDEAGNEILPTVNEWQLFGLEGTYNAQTNRLELRAGGGFDWQESVRAASVANFASTRVGNVLTATGNGALVIDTIAMAVDDRILLKDQSAPANNGLMDVVDAGSASTPAVLQRSALADETGEMTSGLTVHVSEGSTAQAESVWYLATLDPIVVNTTALTFKPRALTPSASASIFVGNAGRQQSDDVSTGFLDIGAMLIDLSGFPATGRTITFEAIIHTNNSPTIPAEVRLFNMSTSLVVTGTTLSTTVGTQTKVTVTITPDATFLATAEQLVSVQLRKTALGVPADLAFCDLARIRVSY